MTNIHKKVSIQLNWDGPLKFDDLVKNQLDKQSPEKYGKGGVYLHCLERDEEFIVIYVGKCASLINRTKEHFKNLNHNKCSIINMKKFKESRNCKDAIIDVAFIPDYGLTEDSTEGTIKDLINEYISEIKIFFASFDDESDITTNKLEGAIQLHL